MSEQLTEFDRPADQAPNSVRDGEFVREFSTTQFVFGYDMSDRFGLESTIPFIIREFDRVERFRTDHETDAGIGDVVLSGNYLPLDYRKADVLVLGGLTAGIKFPSGRTGTLERISTEEAGSIARTEFQHLLHHVVGASGGRALTFGSGSLDFPFAAHFLGRFDRYLFLASAQYTVRTEGAFDYEFADDFLWSVGPGWYFVLGHEHTIAARVSLSGEDKGKDKLDGELVSGSAISNLYVGPELLFTVGSRMTGELGLEVRVTDDDPGSTIVPDFRIRGSVSYRFG